MNGDIASKAQGYTPVGSIASALAALSAADSTLTGSVSTLSSSLSSHTANTSNPHSTTAAQVGAYTTSAVDTALGGKASTGANTFTGSQTVPSGSSFIAMNAGDWPGVAMTGTGLTGKDSSNSTTWSIASATGVFTGVGTGLAGVGLLASRNVFAAPSSSSSANIAQAYTGTYTHSSGTATVYSFTATDSTTGTGGIDILKANLLGSGTGSGAKNLLRLQTASSDRFSVLSNGSATLQAPASVDFTISDNLSSHATINSLHGSLTFKGYSWNAGGASVDMSSIRSYKDTADAAFGGRLSFWTALNSGGGTLTEQMRINSAGNVLIGTTTDDGVNKLQVAGSVSASPTFAHSSGTLTGVNVGLTDSTTGTGGLTALQTQISGSGTGSGSKFHYVAKNAAGTTVASIDTNGSINLPYISDPTKHLTWGFNAPNGSHLGGTGYIYSRHYIEGANEFRGPGMSAYNAMGLWCTGNTTSTSYAITMQNGQAVIKTSGTVTPVVIAPIYNQTSGTAANTDLTINRTETAVGSGPQLLFDAKVNGSSKFNLSNIGRVVVSNTVQLAAIDTGTVAGTVAGQICNDSTSGKVKRWTGSAWASVEV